VAAKQLDHQEQRGNPAVETIDYKVEPDDNLTKIAKAFAKDAGMDEAELADKIFQLNREKFGRSKDDIQAGQVLRIPKQKNPAPIRVGSIIHLENGLENGGYLDARGWVTDMPVISPWQDQNIRKFVSTHESDSRTVGSGSWLVLSAVGKPEGQPLGVGDKIQLLNMNPGSGYLNLFEWVNLLVPFRNYPMQIGVFAASAPGTWTIWPAENKPINGPISLRSFNYADRLIAAPAAGIGLALLPVSDQSDDELKHGAEFMLVPGLADETMVSLRVNGSADRYVVAASGGVVLQNRDEIDELRKATFKRANGLAGAGVSFESLAQPNHYLRHSSFKLKLNPFENTELFREDASFIAVAPISTGENTGDQLLEGDTLYLKSDYPHSRIPGPGFLHTYGEVTKHELFKAYEGQRLFVFTGPSLTGAAEGVTPPNEDGSPLWTVTLSNLPQTLYHVQNAGNGNEPFHEEALFKIGDAAEPPITALDITSNDQGKTLSGTVTCKGGTPKEIHLPAMHHSQNVYAVGNSQWLLGARTQQAITALAIVSDDEGHTLNGTVTYEGERPIRFHAVRGFSKASDAGALLSHVLLSEWLRGRTNRLESDIVDTHRLLSHIFNEMSGRSLDEVMRYIYEKEVNEHAALKKLWRNDESGEAHEMRNMLDRDFQIEQLLNLCILSHLLNAFSRYTLCELMQKSLNEHRTAKDESVAPLYLFRNCFEHIATDHAMIQAAIHQRQWDRSLTANYLSAHVVDLLILDKLAIQCIAPFRRLLLEEVDQLAIVTYLSERTHIHIVPYTKQFILIGVSRDRVTPAASLFEGHDFVGKNFHAFELMAIPHEIGHYIYQHGKIEGKTFLALSEKFQGNPYYRWCEEIFADVYSCIVAGPLAAISMQALLMSIDRDRAWKDDEEHPTPVLRVFIFAEILRTLKTIDEQYGFLKVAQRLDNDWSKILALWGYSAMDRSEGRPVRVYLHDKSELHLDRIVNVERVIKAIRPMIEEFATRLLAVAATGNNRAHQDVRSQDIPWTRYDEDGEGLYKYNVEMARLVNLDFARQKVTRQFLFNVQVDHAPLDLTNPDETLWNYLRRWDDRGPHVFGGH